MEALVSLRDALWGRGTVALLLGTGLFLTVRTGFLPVRNVGRAMSLALSGESRGKGRGISSFAALMTALSATLGTGNIVGVAAAIASGGPGALAWMLLSSIPALSTKFSECLLSVHDRIRPGLGGPMYVMEGHFGPLGRWMGRLFSLGALAVAFTVGSAIQSNAMASAAADSFAVPPLWIGVGAAVGVLAVAQGGIRSISRVSSVLVPLLGVGYFLAALWVILCHITALPGVVLEICRCALTPQAALGGTLGSAMREGITRGVLTHEAGLGSAAITAACASDGDPLRQGYIAETAVVFDTFILCTVTGLAICCSGALDGVRTGAELSIAAFETVFGPWGGVGITAALCLFAFTSILGWAYQGEAAWVYLFGGKNVGLFRLLLSACTLLGAVAELETVLVLGDIANALMCYPNLISLLLLGGTVARVCRGTAHINRH